MSHLPDKLAPELEGPDAPFQWQHSRPPSTLAPTEVREQVRHRPSTLDVVEQANTKERLDLNVVWNRASPINRLSNDTLAFIFTHIANDLLASASPNHDGRCYASTKWTRLILVCQHWRSVAYTSPQLWRHVICTQSPRYTERALALSTTELIDVSFGSHKPSPKNFFLLQSHTHRIRSLHFDAVKKGWMAATLALLQSEQGMPALEDLKLPFTVTADGEPGDGDFVDIRLTHQKFPRLRSLTSTFIVVPQNSQLYVHLRKVSLRQCRCNSLDLFLDALAASANLQSLELYSTLQHIQLEGVHCRTVTRRHPVSLGRLESLRLIADPPANTSQFLSHLRLPPTVSVTIVPAFGDEDVLGEDIAGPLVATALLPSNPGLVLPSLGLIHAVTIHVDDEEYSLRGSIEPDKYLITLELESSSISQSWSLFSPHAMCDLASIFAFAPLTTLIFHGNCDQVGVETWRRIFRTYPLLNTLDTGDTFGTTATVVWALTPMGTPNSLVPCPNLRHLTVTGEFPEEDMERMLECLIDRENKGCRLESISIELCGFDEEDGMVMEMEYMPDLRDLVSNVNFKFTLC